MPSISAQPGLKAVSHQSQRTDTQDPTVEANIRGCSAPTTGRVPPRVRTLHHANEEGFQSKSIMKIDATFIGHLVML